MRGSLRELWSITARWTALELREAGRRLYCRWFGHRVVRETAGAPVTEFWVCTRCGRFGR